MSRAGGTACLLPLPWGLMEAPYSRTLADLLFEQASRYGAAPAVFAGRDVVSYRDLLDRAGRVAGALRARGMRRGDRVGLLVNNRTEWLEAFFGIGMAGGVAVAFSTWSTTDELDWLIQDSGIRALIMLDRFADNDFVAALRQLGLSRYPGLHDVMVVGDAGVFERYDSLLESAPVARRAPGEAPSARDDAIIIYTSGSSSRPKSVPLSHGGIIENGFNIGERQGYGPDDRVLLAPPLFWSYGSANAMSAMLTHGAALVLQARFEPARPLT